MSILKLARAFPFRTEINLVVVCVVPSFSLAQMKLHSVIGLARTSGFLPQRLLE